MIQVIVVDDHPLFREGLIMTFRFAYPDISVSGEADCGKALFELLPSTPADLVLLDFHLPDMDGAEIARRLRATYPALKILAVSAENSAQKVQEMLEAGIDGFISKQQSHSDELAQAIRTVAGGIEYYGRDIASILLGVYVAAKKSAAITPDFTERERQIIRLCRDGLICKEIADRLGISINTVNTHKKSIFQKLGINNTMEMVRYALKNGVIRIEN
ncbi:MAG: response regulator transcription factor [Bacteroidetes bacterium]|nr:response regulator transcription factor [Bacteroidota bacterium]